MEVLRARSGPCRTRGPFLAFLPSSLFVAAVLRDVFDEFASDQPKLGLSVSVAVLQPGADYVSCSSASGVYGGVSRQRGGLL